MSKKSTIAEAAASGDLSAAISEEVKPTIMAPRLSVKDSVEENPAFKPTHLHHGVTPVQFMYEHASHDLTMVRFEDRFDQWVHTNMLTPIEEKKPDWKPTHWTDNNEPVMVFVEKPEIWHSVMVQFKDGRKVEHFTSKLRPIKSVEKKPEWKPTHTFKDNVHNEEHRVAIVEERPNDQFTIRYIGGRHDGFFTITPRSRLTPITEKTMTDEPETEPQELVEFTITRAMFRDHHITGEIKEAFGVRPMDYISHEDLKVTCRPDQFGRFVARLAQKGISTQKLISVRLFTPRPPKPENRIDASRNGLS